jgi:hypothetical protein
MAYTVPLGMTTRGRGEREIADSSAASCQGALLPRPVRQWPAPAEIRARPIRSLPSAGLTPSQGDFPSKSWRGGNVSTCSRVECGFLRRKRPSFVPKRARWGNEATWRPAATRPNAGASPQNPRLLRRVLYRTQGSPGRGNESPAETVVGCFSPMSSLWRAVSFLPSRLLGPRSHSSGPSVGVPVALARARFRRAIPSLLRATSFGHRLGKPSTRVPIRKAFLSAPQSSVRTRWFCGYCGC